MKKYWCCGAICATCKRGLLAHCKTRIFSFRGTRNAVARLPIMANWTRFSALLTIWTYWTSFLAISTTILDTTCTKSQKRAKRGKRQRKPTSSARVTPRKIDHRAPTPPAGRTHNRQSALSGALFCLLFKRVSSFVGSPSHSPKQARYSRFFCAMRQSYIPKWKSLHRRLQGPYSKACKIQLQITCRATAQSKTQQKRQDRILFTPLVPDRTLIRVRFSRLCVHRLTPCPAAGFCIRRDSVTASIIGLLFWPTILPTTQFYYILLNYLFFQKSFDIPCIMSF